MKNISKFKIIALGLLAVVPQITFAASSPKTLRDLVALIVQYINIAIYLIIALAVVTFIWNVYRYFFTEKDKKEASMYVLYSVIGFFVILSFWGLVAILSGSLNLQNTQPNFPFGGGGGNSGGSIFGTPGTNSGNSIFGTPGTNSGSGNTSSFDANNANSSYVPPAPSGDQQFDPNTGDPVSSSPTDNSVQQFDPNTGDPIQ